MVGMRPQMGYTTNAVIKQQLQSVSSGQQGVSRASSICVAENTSRENNKQTGGEELEPPTPPSAQQQQRRPTLLRVPSISNQDVSGVNNNDVYESVSVVSSELGRCQYLKGSNSRKPQLVAKISV